MKKFYIILTVLVAVVAVIFALQNSVAITVTFFSWSISGSLSLFLIVTLAIGILLGILTMTPSVFKHKRAASGLKKQVAVLEKGKNTLGQKGAEADAIPDTAAPPVGEAAAASKKRE